MVRTLIALTVLLTVSERALADGNVEADFQAGTLTLVGDTLDNDVSVEFPNSGGYIVTGNAGTTINGQAVPFADVDADVENLNAQMNGGHDTMTVTSTGGLQTSLEGRAQVGLGDGNDFVEIVDIEFQQGVDVAGDQGEDEIILELVSTGSGLEEGVFIQGGADEDTIMVLENMTGASIEIGGGGGDDFLEIDSSSVGHSVDLFGDSGKDEIHLSLSEIAVNVLILSGSETDLVSVESILVGADLQWEGGEGSDGFVITDSEIFGELRLDGVWDDDLIGLSGVNVQQRAFLRGYDGDDLVVLSDTPSGPNTFEADVRIDTEFDDDGVDFCGVHNFFENLIVEGGFSFRDFDQLSMEAPQNVDGRLIIRQFEDEDANLDQRRADMIADLAECFPGIAETSFPLLCGAPGGAE